MKSSEKGFTITELLIAVSMIALISSSAVMVIFQVLHGTQRNNDYLTSVRQVENAGYWISRDTQMAQSVITDNLTSPDFILVNWTEWDAGGQPIYHSVRYFFENIITGNGELKRYHWSSAGANEETLIARHIFFDSDNITYTSKASYQFPMLALKLTASYENVLESREYKVVRRLNY